MLRPETRKDHLNHARPDRRMRTRNAGGKSVRAPSARPTREAEVPKGVTVPALEGNFQRAVARAFCDGRLPEPVTS
jgi:hypothetical protein